MASNDTTDPASPTDSGAGQPERTKAEAARVDSGSDSGSGSDSSTDSGGGSSSGSGSGSGTEMKPTRGTKEPPPDPPIGTPPPRG
jgi:hypothetical protein